MSFQTDITVLERYGHGEGFDKAIRTILCCSLCSLQIISTNVNVVVRSATDP